MLLLFAASAAAVAFGLKTWRDRTGHVSADTVFVSAPAWPKAEPRAPAPQSPPASKEYLLEVGAFVDKRDAEALADRLTGLSWPVSIVVPVSATDSLNKVIVSGIASAATARRTADSLGSALRLKVTILEPMGARTR